MKTLPSIHIEFILHYITLTNYYNAKNIFKSQVTTAQQNVVMKKNKVNKMTNQPSIHIDYILYYITLTTYYKAKNTCRA